MPLAQAPAAPPGHWRPQKPQLSGSELATGWQVPPQQSPSPPSEMGQLLLSGLSVQSMQAVAELEPMIFVPQNFPGLQVIPQPPQFSGSARVVQVAPQHVPRLSMPTSEVAQDRPLRSV